MTRWVPRLTWDLTRVLLAQKLFGASRHPLALHLDLAGIFGAEPGRFR